MNPLAVFLVSLTLAWFFAALLPVFWRKSVNLSLGLALLTNLAAAGFSAATWLGALKWDVWKIPVDLWRGVDVALGNQMLPPLSLEFNLDALSAFFIFLVTSFSTLVAVYSFKALQAPHYQAYAHWIASAFNLFTWSTVMVLAAHDGVSLLISLELMTLSFGYLALYKHFLYQDNKEHPVEEEKQRKAFIAPQVYLMISHTSTVFLLLAVLLLAIHADGWSYQRFASNAENLSTPLMNVIFLFALAGLGIRAGLTPAHIWVSLVHPSSPTTTHALSLGIAIKVAVYLMYRFFFQFLPPQPWWGYLLLAVAVMTALVNVWYAISSHDLKEALAYHSIENIGIICAGIGFGLIFWEQNRSLAYLGLVASLYHLLNHAVFKGLLYLATGAIDNLTHQTVNIDRLGGLIHKYRFTASMFLVGAFSISGFPPLNGFISEWLTLQTGLIGLSNLQGHAGFLVALVSLLLLVSAFALTAFCFYKMAGVALLGMPRLPEEKREKWENDDVHFSMKGVMRLMAALCLLLGVFPGLVAPQLVKAFEPLQMPENFWSSDQTAWYEFQLPKDTLPYPPHPENYRLPIRVLIVVPVALMIAVLFRGLFHPRFETHRPKIPWNCGEPLQPQPIHQYTSGALSFSLRRLFSLGNDAPSAPEHLPARLILSESPDNPQHITEVFRLGYNRITDKLLHFSEAFGKNIQNGDVRRYLQYVFYVTIITFILYWLTKGS